MNRIEKDLFAMQDTEYRDFTASLLPGIPEEIIGVRLPVLRKYAKGLKDTKEFTDTLPHRWHEENLLHCFLIEKIKDYDECIQELDRFLPYVTNWAVCDTINPKVFAKRHDRLYEDAKRWIADGRPYIVRCGVGTLMRHYLNEDFDPAYPELVASVKSDEYYVNMMCAWYFATALAKQWDAVIPYFEEYRLEPDVRLKAIRKARESYRVTDSQKEYLKQFRTEPSVSG